jgi:uncharacterized protein YkwD
MTRTSAATRQTSRFLDDCWTTSDLKSTRCLLPARMKTTPRPLLIAMALLSLQSVSVPAAAAHLRSLSASPAGNAGEAANAATRAALQAACTWDTPKGNAYLSAAQIKPILDTHNQARQAVPATFMPMLKWDADLADFAQQTASSCIGMVQSSHDDRTNRAGYVYVVENLAAGGSGSGLDANHGAEMVNLFLAERPYWQVCLACS